MQQRNYGPSSNSTSVPSSSTRQFAYTVVNVLLRIHNPYYTWEIKLGRQSFHLKRWVSLLLFSAFRQVWVIVGIADHRHCCDNTDTWKWSMRYVTVLLFAYPLSISSTVLPLWATRYSDSDCLHAALFSTWWIDGWLHRSSLALESMLQTVCSSCQRPLDRRLGGPGDQRRALKASGYGLDVAMYGSTMYDYMQRSSMKASSYKP